MASSNDALAAKAIRIRAILDAATILYKSPYDYIRAELKAYDAGATTTVGEVMGALRALLDLAEEALAAGENDQPKEGKPNE